jgi:hypothetical protein
MSGAGASGQTQRARTRLELARGHWSLGEHEEALVCLERLEESDPQAAGLAALVEELRDDPSAGAPADVAERLEALARRLNPPAPIAPLPGSPLATGTLASLLVDQGHGAAALAVAEDVLRARPDDVRALAVRERVRGGQPQRALERLERWLGQIERRRRREGVQA